MTTALDQQRKHRCSAINLCDMWDPARRLPASHAWNQVTPRQLLPPKGASSRRGLSRQAASPPTRLSRQSASSSRLSRQALSTDALSRNRPHSIGRASRDAPHLRRRAASIAIGCLSLSGLDPSQHLSWADLASHASASRPRQRASLLIPCDTVCSPTIWCLTPPPPLVACPAVAAASDASAVAPSPPGLSPHSPPRPPSPSTAPR